MRSLMVRNIVLGSVAVIAILGIVFGIQAFHGVSTQSMKAHADSVLNPGGPWNLTVTFTDTGEQSPSSLSLDANSQLTNYTPFPGTGTWSTISADQFQYQFTEQINDPNGNQVGYVQVEQQATLSSDGTSYDAQGQGTVYAMDGTVEASNPTSTHATRPISNISPTVECVTNNGDGTYTALFGYANRNAYNVAVPVGDSNHFTGGSSDDLGQPSVFVSGRQYGVFKVNFDGNSLVWYVAGRTATASTSSRSC